MSKRATYMKTLEESRQKTMESITKKTDAVDETINALEEKAAESTKAPAKTVKTEPATKEDQAKTGAVKLSGSLALELKPKESRKVHKSILIPASMAEKLSALSNQSGVSENEIINQILEKAFA